MAIYQQTGAVPEQTGLMAAKRTLRDGTTVLGAVLSLGLLLGGGIWSVKLIIRDVSGVPIVRAMTSPVRELPADPGGTAMNNMGLSVNTIAAEGVAAPTPDALTLAPVPVELTEEDATVATLMQGSASPATVINASVAAMVAELTRGSAPLDAQGPADPRAVDPSAAPALPVAPLTEVAALDSETSLDPQPVDAAQVAPLDDAGQSLRPRERPQRLGWDAAPADNATVAAAIEAVIFAALDTIDPENLPSGTRLAQLGAFESPEIAAREWDRLGQRFGDYLDGKSRVIQEAQSGGRTFFRLRAHGFDDLDAARRFCAALQAERAECIPVVTR